jgi:hypothetical protein
LRAVQVAQKLPQIFFYKIKENCTMLDRSICPREALVHSILIIEVKDMKSDVLRALKGISFWKKTLNLVYELNFNNFQERKVA